MITEYSSIGLESTIGFGRVRGILTARNKNTIGFSRIRSDNLGAYKNRFSNNKKISSVNRKNPVRATKKF